MNQMNGTATVNAAKAPGARLPLTAARVAALAVGVPACLAIVVSAGYSLVESIGKGTLPVSYTFPVGTRGVAVSVDGGNLVLRQAGGDRGSIVGTGTYSLIRPRITKHSSDGTASLSYSCRAPGGNCALDAAVKVPAGRPVSLYTDGGNITADGISSPAHLTTDGGNVTASQATGDLTLNSGGGDVRAIGIASARVTAGTGGGNIEIVFTRAPRNVVVTTGGGNITIVVPRGPTHYDVTVSDAAGGANVTDNAIPVNSSSPDKIHATTGGGYITIRQAAT
jgi:putative adhesin